MARTSLPITSLTGNGSVMTLTNAGTGFTAFDNTNGMSVAIPTTGFPATGSSQQLVLLVLNTNGTGRTITVRAASPDGGVAKLGAGTSSPAFTYPAFEAGKGDLTTAAMTLTTGIGIIGPLSPSRFIQPDGTISIDASGAVGFIAAFLISRSF